MVLFGEEKKIMYMLGRAAKVETGILKWIHFLILGKIVDGLLVMRKIEVS